MLGLIDLKFLLTTKEINYAYGIHNYDVSWFTFKQNITGLHVSLALKPFAPKYHSKVITFSLCEQCVSCWGMCKK